MTMRDTFHETAMRLGANFVGPAITKEMTMDELKQTPGQEAAAEIHEHLFGPPTADRDTQQIQDMERIIRRHMGADLDRVKGERGELLAACKRTEEAVREAAIHQHPDDTSDLPWYAQLRAAIAHCDHHAGPGKMIEGGKDGKP